MLVGAIVLGGANPFICDAALAHAQSSACRAGTPVPSAKRCGCCRNGRCLRQAKSALCCGKSRERKTPLPPLGKQRPNGILSVGMMLADAAVSDAARQFAPETARLSTACSTLQNLLVRMQI